MRTKPELFQAVIAASPWLAWDDKRELRELIPFVSSSSLRVRTLFLSHSSETADMKPNVDALVAALRQRGDASVRWVAREYPDETHDTNVLKSFYDGLRMIFAGNATPRDSTVYR
jgi:predicted alpha/beta superfamily hydrolase